MIVKLRAIKEARKVLQEAQVTVREARDMGFRPVDIVRETGLSREGVWKMLKRED